MAKSGIGFPASSYSVLIAQYLLVFLQKLSEIELLARPHISIRKGFSLGSGSLVYTIRPLRELSFKASARGSWWVSFSTSFNILFVIDFWKAMGGKR